MTDPVDPAPATSVGPAVLPSLVAPRRRIGRREFDFDRQVAVMAIVNRTPDSFYDEGRDFALDRAVAAALRAVEQGADWVDVGGVPFSPDTPEVSAAEELARVLPVVEQVAAASDVVISVDTTSAEVAERCLAAGAAVVNDTSGLYDPRMAEVVASSGATLVVTHSLAAPHRHLPRPHYDDVAAEVAARLADRVAVALAAGITPDQLIIDPGHDLNKNTRHTLELTRRLAEVAELGHPVLAAISRKDFVGETLGRAKPDRLAGSLAATTWALCAGARIIRVHDVAESVDTVRMFEAILGWRDPVELRHNM
ncbi:dihydropteroate synthase [Propionibacteriaceae bacterium Y2011]|uniref:dihydropteroate synthase n=1 Tax=Microlunatus sp. Y2014 TaxID=3418488 RepID=UPI003B48CFDC